MAAALLRTGCVGLEAERRSSDTNRSVTTATRSGHHYEVTPRGSFQNPFVGGVEFSNAGVRTWPLLMW